MLSTISTRVEAGTFQGTTAARDVVPELRYLESEGLVTRTAHPVAPRWSVGPAGERLLAAHDQFPRSTP